MKFVSDSKRAKLVLRRLQEAFTAGEGLLSEVDDLVENQIPRGVMPLSREHSLFLFYIIANDHGMKSSRLYARAKDLYHLRPDLFDPNEVLEKYDGEDDYELVEATGKSLGTRYPRQTGKTWYRNSKRLRDFFAADPRELFCSYSNAEELLREIKFFRGYGAKTGGMLLRAIVGLGFCTLDALGNVLVPVDIHDSRISFLTGIARVDGHGKDTDIDYYSYARQIQRVLLDTCNDLGIPWLDVDRALWLTGSRGCVSLRCGHCSLKEFCRVGKTVDEEKSRDSMRVGHRPSASGSPLQSSGHALKDVRGP